MLGQAEYASDGAPTPLEEEIRWLLNRARFDRNAENARRGTNYADIPLSSGPLAPNQSLTLASRHHAEDCARLNAVGHATPQGTAFYNSQTQPGPGERFIAEGYSPNMLGWFENWHAGTDHFTGPPAYLSWWISEAHRRQMCHPVISEIGTGYFYRPASTYRNYFVMGLAAMPAGAWFTDTIFFDQNGSTGYEAGEGISNVRISLRIAGQEFSIYDVSSAAGAFAIPVQTVSSGMPAEVWLTNKKPSGVTLSIPQTATTLRRVTLAAGESTAAGVMTRTASGGNTGFRQLAAYVAPLPLPVLNAIKQGSAIRISWESQTGIQYLLQHSPDLQQWENRAEGFQDGTGAAMSVTDTPGPGVEQRFYRLSVRRP